MRERRKSERDHNGRNIHLNYVYFTRSPKRSKEEESESHPKIVLVCKVALPCAVCGMAAVIFHFLFCRLSPNSILFFQLSPFSLCILLLLLFRLLIVVL